MTRTVAILADVHGNMPALRAVCADIERQRPDEVLVAGDLVGRGPEGSRVVAAIAERGWRCLRGNHEDYLLGFARREVPDDWWDEEEWAASRWMAAELEPSALEFIDALPAELRPAVGGDLLVVHGSPRSNNEGLGPWTRDRELEEHLDSIDETLLVCGHTHRPMDRKVRNGRAVNVGAVGLPFNRDRRAQYALFRHDGSSWSVEFRQVGYDTAELLRIYRTSGFQEAGGLTAELLRLEVRQAAPFLVPFLKWARLTGRRPRAARIGEFLDLYDPTEPMHDFFHRLRALRR